MLATILLFLVSGCTFPDGPDGFCDYIHEYENEPAHINDTAPKTIFLACYPESDDCGSSLLTSEGAVRAACKACEASGGSCTTDASPRCWDDDHYSEDPVAIECAHPK